MRYGEVPVWRVRVDGAEAVPAGAEEAVAAVRRAVEAGTGELWVEHDDGRSLGVVVGGPRAFAMYLGYDGDAGFHAVDQEGAEDRFGRYRLSNGQVDSYADRDTVPVAEIPAVVRHLIGTGERWPGVTWEDDGAQ